MRRIGPGPKRLREIERILKREIRWAVDEGPGWDPKTGVYAATCDASWRTLSACGTCAIGALVLRRRLPAASMADGKTGDVIAAARALRAHPDWVNALYCVVGFPHSSSFDDVAPTAVALARRLRKYGDALAAEKGARS